MDSVEFSFELIRTLIKDESSPRRMTPGEAKELYEDLIEFLQEEIAGVENS